MYEEQFSKRLTELRTQKGVSARDMSLSIGQNPGYHGEFSEERLIRALRSVHPMEIYRSGMDNPAKLPGWKKYVFPIYMAYNGKCRKDALPMKF